MYFDNKSCGARIRRLREQAGLSQEALAKRLHVTSIHLSRIETGAWGASLDVLMEVSAVFGVSIDYLVAGQTTFTGQEVKARLRSIIHELTELEETLKG